MREVWSRLGRLLGALWLIVSLTFFAVYALPGDPARLILGQRANTETLEAFRQAAGLNDPLGAQYFHFLTKAAEFEFGDSLVQRRPIIDLIAERSPQTMVLVLAAIAVVAIFSLVIPLLIGLADHWSWLTWMDSFWGVPAAAPPYVLAVLLLLVFGGWLELVPTIFDPNIPLSWGLPALTLAAYPTAIVLKLFHQEIELAHGALYVTRARAMGFSKGFILLTEILPNAITPAVAALANSLAFFITGTFFVEVVFGVTGLGSLTYEAIRNNDLALLMGLCIVFATAITIISTSLEIALILSNPRLRNRHD